MAWYDVAQYRRAAGGWMVRQVILRVATLLGRMIRFLIGCVKYLFTPYVVGAALIIRGVEIVSRPAAFVVAGVLILAIQFMGGRSGGEE